MRQEQLLGALVEMMKDTALSENERKRYRDRFDSILDQDSKQQLLEYQAKKAEVDRAETVHSFAVVVASIALAFSIPILIAGLVLQSYRILVPGVAMLALAAGAFHKSKQPPKP